MVLIADTVGAPAYVNLPLHSVSRRVLQLRFSVQAQIDVYPGVLLHIGNLLSVRIDSVGDLYLSYKKRNLANLGEYEEVIARVASGLQPPFEVSLDLNNLGYSNGSIYMVVTKDGETWELRHINLDWRSPLSDPALFKPAALQLGIVAPKRVGYSITFGNDLQVRGDLAGPGNEWYTIEGFQGLSTTVPGEDKNWIGARDPFENATHTDPTDLRALPRFKYAKPLQSVSGLLRGLKWQLPREPSYRPDLEPHDYETYLGFQADVSEPQRNLLTENQSSIEKDLTGIGGNATRARSTDYAEHGLASLALHAVSPTTDQYCLMTGLALAPSTTYAWQAMIYVPVPTRISNDIALMEAASPYRRVGAVIGGSRILKVGWHILIGKGTTPVDWAPATHLLLRPARTDDNATYDTAKILYFDKLQVEEGSVATPWMLGGPSRSEHNVEAHWKRLGEGVGRSHALSRESISFGTSFAQVVENARWRDTLPLFSWEPHNHTPAQIASGAADAIIGNAAIELRDVLNFFLAFGPRMNHHTSPWASYAIDGSPRASTPKNFIDAWRRIKLIFEGGTIANINTRLLRSEQPALNAAATLTNGVSLGNAAAVLDQVRGVVWTWAPAFRHAPFIDANRFQRYFPGDKEVGWVGTQIDNSSRFIDQLPDLEYFYNVYSRLGGKPFMLENWRMLSDDPAFVGDVFEWIEGRPKAKALMYRNQGTGALAALPAVSRKYASAIYGKDKYIIDQERG